MTSTTRSASRRTSSKSPRLRVRTPVIRGRRPVMASTCPARCARSWAKADPTVPWPRRPTRNAPAPASAAIGDVAGEEVVVGLAAHDDAGVAVLDEDDGRAAGAVVVVGHREPVGAGRRRHDDVAYPRRG